MHLFALRNDLLGLFFLGKQRGNNLGADLESLRHSEMYDGLGRPQWAVVDRVTSENDSPLLGGFGLKELDKSER